MGWWQTEDGGVIGDPAAGYLMMLGRVWDTPSQIPSEVRERLEALYLENLGRLPTDSDLRNLLEFCR